jgi:hypothetical protein
MTVTIVLVMPMSRLRASSAVPWKASGEPGPRLTCDSSTPSSKATTTDPVGSSHSEPRLYSRSASRRIIADLPVPAAEPPGLEQDQLSAR